MQLFGYQVPLVVVLVGIAFAYATNYPLLRVFYGSPDFKHGSWRDRVLWGIGLLIPVSGVIILLLAAVFTFLIIAFMVAQIEITAAIDRLNPI
jgi:hypothetical protein